MDSGGIRIPPREETEGEMKRQPKPCSNCGRPKKLVKEGHCFLCAKAAKGLEGEAKDKALAAIKAKIQAGEVKTWNKREKAEPAGPAAQDPATGKAPANEPADPPALPPAMARKRSYLDGPKIGDLAEAGEMGDPPAPPEEFLSIRFAGDDTVLLSTFRAVSGRFRRTVEDQVLYLIQHFVEFDRRREASLGYFRPEYGRDLTRPE